MRKHLNPSMAVALVALFVALSGASYAAIQLPRNSVGSQQIRNNAVGASEVRNGSLKADDFMAGQLPRGQQGPRGETGATGAQGETGAQGATGPRGPSDLYWALGSSGTVLSGSATYFTVAEMSLPPGDYRVTGTLTVNTYFNPSFIAAGRTEWMVDCHLWPTDGSPIADSYAGNTQARVASDRDLVPMSLDGAFERSGSSSNVNIRLRCAQVTNPSSPNVVISISSPTLTAIKVATSTPIPN